ncbi:hypothetical protein GX51_03626 [Blastomyces parvus]|uniref:Uncharacterized protein n=1 Tax=Blastomyces parvus TaxID=2060905 RepID=A0A2B7X687_9EURO|nr:hypothetical protein GX51_03626 [Blastomyces parvus]
MSSNIVHYGAESPSQRRRCSSFVDILQQTSGYLGPSEEVLRNIRSGGLTKDHHNETLDANTPDTKAARCLCPQKESRLNCLSRQPVAGRSVLSMRSGRRALETSGVGRDWVSLPRCRNGKFTCSELVIRIVM